jgi:hypothetical protein
MVSAPRPQPGSPSGPAAPVAALLLLVTLVATPAGAQIVKCTDGSGNIVYQNSACPKNTKADRVDIFDNSWTADRVEKDAAWQRQASEHRVVAGMPARWVREALGEPSEVRKTATAGADAVWLYSFPDRSAQVGILADQVLWFRETPVVAPVARADPEPAAAPTSRPALDTLHAAPESARSEVTPKPTAAPASPSAQDILQVPEISRSAQASPKVSESRHGIARGQDCRQALAELGTPDRTREVPAIDSKSDPTTEYFYEPAGSASPTRTRIVCANGKVEGVDRSVIR